MRTFVVAALVVAGLLVGSGPAAAAPPPYYPSLRWVPAADGNFTVGRGGARIEYVIIHGTAGPYAGAISWFRDRRSGLSAHYVVRSSDGEITQLVAEADTAFHARGFNQRGIGIEHEFDPSHGIGYTDAQYRSSATLVCAIGRRYGIPLDRSHILGHSELANSDHTDPGPSWNWSFYMSLVGSCSSGGATVASASAGDAMSCDARGCRPLPGLSFGATGPAVSLLQWDLAYLGRLRPIDVAQGGGRFGPLTEAAVRAYQAANGLPSVGVYGERTAAALRSSLDLGPSGVPLADLTLGDGGGDVTRLQSALGRLGYMDAVTGYFGPVTQAAVRRFQADNAITATGSYGPLTRTALAVRAR